MSVDTEVRPAMLVKSIGAVILFVGTSSACVIDDVPSCPGQCFAYTLEQAVPSPCRDDGGTQYDISFTANDPDGYRGRTCFNATSVALVVEAIDHLHTGGLLSDLDPEIQSAYLSTVNTVRADLEAQCITAAPGQCTNAAEVCSVVGSVMYEQLVIDETCVLALDGAQAVALGPGQVCEPLASDGTGSDAAGDHCVETTATADGLDGTASSGGADETTG